MALRLPYRNESTALCSSYRNGTHCHSCLSFVSGQGRAGQGGKDRARERAKERGEAGGYCCIFCTSRRITTCA